MTGRHLTCSGVGRTPFELAQEVFGAHLLVELLYAARDFLRFHLLHSLHKDFCRGERPKILAL